MQNKGKILIVSAVTLSVISGVALLWAKQVHSPQIPQQLPVSDLSQQPPAASSSSAAVTETSPVIEKEKPKKFTALFVGDMMLDRHVGEKIKRNGLDSLLKAFKEGKESNAGDGLDMVSANLEGATTDKGAHYPPANGNDFAFDPKVVGQLKDYSFTFFNIANNHLTDQNAKGVTETRRNLSALGYGFSGCGDRQIGDCTATIMRFGSTTVAMLGFSMVYGDFDLKQATAEIAKEKKQADFVIVNIHWGSEYTHQFSKKQQAVGHALADAGADAIIGHHPHVIQGVEVYKNKPIFYSLGNFLFDQYFSQDTQRGLAVKLTMEEGKADIKIYPLISKSSVPAFADGTAKEGILKDVASWSSCQDCKNKISQGQMSLIR